MGFDVRLDKDGYVYVKIDFNIDKKVLSIGFIVYVDIFLDVLGKDVNLRIIKNYDGLLIKLNEIFQMYLDKYFLLKKVIGEDIIVIDGNILLGVDDKVGVVEIMEFFYRIVDDKFIEYGDIYICFIFDEEIG